MVQELHAGSIKAPVNAWLDLIHSDMPEKDLAEALRDIYRTQRPSVAELILEAYCPNRCKHCIYPPDYHRFNETLSSGKWAEVLRKLYANIGLRTFIFSGRSLTGKGINVIRAFRHEFPDGRIGLICEGRSLEPLAAGIISLAPDWVDVSLDGMENEHDTQRDDPGSFQRSIDVLRLLKDSGVLPKINILTCLTTLNMGSVLDMIGLLNGEGFKNFFITPVTVARGYRPDPALEPKMADFVRFVDRLVSFAETLADSWVELDIYEAIYARAIQMFRPELFSGFVIDDEHLEFVRENGDNEIHLAYYPSSLTGLREFIVNSDGRVIPPKVMAMGKIPKKLIFGNALDLTGERDIFDGLMNSEAFSFYVAELLQEKALLKL